METCVSQFEEAYHETFDTMKGFAEQYADDIALLVDMPENLRYYFDFEAWARDLELSGDIFTTRTEEGLPFLVTPEIKIPFGVNLPQTQK